MSNVYCCVCATVRTSEGTCAAMGVRYTEYYVLNEQQHMHICGDCVDRFVEARIQGLVKEVEGLRVVAERERGLWEERNRDLEDIMSFDVDTMPYSVMKEVCRQVKQLSRGEKP